MTNDKPELKHAQCSQCKSFNTELEIEELFEGLSVTVWCRDCMTYSQFDSDEDWREYE